MTSPFTTLDLSPHWNHGVKNIKTPEGWLWPTGPDRPQDAPLDSLPAGDHLFYGVPFKLASRPPDPASPFVLVVAKCAKSGVPDSVRLPIGRKARRVLFAHVCAPLRSAIYDPATERGIGTVEGTGERLGSYQLVFADGTFADCVLRRRYEIHDVFVPFGHRAFLCRNCAEFHPIPLGSRVAEYGATQQGVMTRGGVGADLRGWWLFDWQNPSPEKVITELRISASGSTPIALGAITLCDEKTDPFVWPARREIAVSVAGGESDASPVKVAVERGILARQDSLFVPREDFLTSTEAGWGRGGSDVKPGSYLEVYASREATIKVKAATREEATFRWGDVLDQGVRQDQDVRVEVVSPSGKQWVHVRVEDEDTGKLVGSRVHFRTPHGAYFAPHGHQSDVNPAWFEDIGGDCKVRGVPYAYIDGTCQINLPVGTVFVEVVRGFEYSPLRTRLNIREGQRDFTLKIKRALDPKSRGFYSGDTHVHFLSLQSSHLEAAAEDLNVVNLLVSQWGRLFTSWEEYTGGLSPTSSRDHLIWVGQENRQHVLGHISLLGLKEMIFPMCTGGPYEDWIGGEISALLADWAKACREQGGLVIMPHMPLPDFENTANVILGHVDAAELCWIWEGERIGQGERAYYRWLNSGQKLPVVGGTDKMSNSRILGGSRTYARLGKDEEFSFEAWCRAVRRGSTFASTGAMIDLTVEGRGMGEEIRLPGNGGAVEVIATAESVWPLTAIELIVNGQPVAREYAESGGRRVAIQYKHQVKKSSWVAARCWGPFFTDPGPVMAHSSPVYIDVGGQHAFEPDDGEYMLNQMEGGILWAERLGVFSDEKLRNRLVGNFREAQAILKRRGVV